MSNLILGFSNRTDTAAFYYGNWQPALPLSNLATREQWKVARSVNTTQASTSFQVHLSRVCNLRTIAIANHNFSANALWRVTIGSTPGANDLYDSGLQPIWYLTFDSDLLEWESASFWEGALDDPSEYLGYPYLATHTMPTWINGQYLTFSFIDESNPAGYVQIGRLFVGGGFQPKINAAYGRQDGWTSMTEITETDSGASLAIVRRSRRFTKFALDKLSHSEAAIVHEIQRRQGVWGEILYLPDTANPADCQRYGMLGRLEQLDAIAYPYPSTRSVGFSIKEL